MSVQSLRFEPDPVLRAPARPVVRFAAELRQLARDLMDTMEAHDGIGAAAPQIGWDVQVCVANPTRQRGRELVVVNPMLTPLDGRAAIQEGCLSIPDVWDRVRRAARVRLLGQDLDGRPFTLVADGVLAIVLQHEIDHLEGRLFIDRLHWLRRRRAQATIRAWARSHRDPAPASPWQGADALAEPRAAAARR